MPRIVGAAVTLAMPDTVLEYGMVVVSYGSCAAEGSARPCPFAQSGHDRAHAWTVAIISFCQATCTDL